MSGRSRSRGRKQPYVLFCQERAELDPALRGKTLPELVALCSEQWMRLTLADRQKYVHMATEYNRPGSYPGAEPPPADGDFRGRFDCYGRSMVALKTKEEMDKYDLAVMLADIDRRVDRACADGTLDRVRFHVMAINSWVETKEGEKGRIIPAEVGLVEMTLRGGIGTVTHALIDPGIPPKGYKGDMKTMSDKFHKIWLDNEELTDDYPEIMDSFRSLLSVRPGEVRAGSGISVGGFNHLSEALRHRAAGEEGGEKEFLPLYVMPRSKETCRKAVNWLQSKAGTNFVFRFYDLHRLLVKLVRASAAKEFSPNIAEAELERDVFLYTPGVSCRFHERVECPCCAPAAAIRQCLVVCDHCCRGLGVAAVEGKHTPWGVKPNTFALTV